MRTVKSSSCDATRRAGPVLRRDAPGGRRDAGVPRAPVSASPRCSVDDDGTQFGTTGLVMRRVPGETIARRILRDDEFAGARAALVGDLGRFLAGLHAIDPAEVPGRRGPGSGGADLGEVPARLDDRSADVRSGARLVGVAPPAADHRRADPRRPADRQHHRRPDRPGGGHRLGAGASRRPARGPRLAVREGMAVRRRRSRSAGSARSTSWSTPTKRPAVGPSTAARCTGGWSIEDPAVGHRLHAAGRHPPRRAGSGRWSWRPSADGRPSRSGT